MAEKTQTSGFIAREVEEGSVSGTVRAVDLNFTRMLTMLDGTIDGQIARADHKAQLVLGANAILIASVSLDQGMIRNALAGTISTLEVASIVLAIMVIISLLLSVFFALLTARPNVAPPVQDLNPFFFGHIALLDADDFSERFLDLNSAEIKLYVLSQINAKARVARTKFVNIRYSLDFLFIALVLWLAVRLLLAFV